MSTCDLVGLQLAYGDVATCKDVIQKTCASGTKFTNDNGISDVNACISALKASCDGYFETLAHPPAACRSKAGGVADQATGCGESGQCVMGDYCNLSNATVKDPRCMQGTCNGLQTENNSCSTDGDCEVRSGNHCVATFQAGQGGAGPTSDGNTVCQQMQYGGSGAACVPGTNHQCQAAFYCGPNDACIPKVAANSQCTPSDGSCDDRVQLACTTPAGGSANACTPPTVVPVGAQCGVVNGAIQLCYGNAFCDTAQTPNKCVARPTQGQGCLATPTDNCFAAYGLHCAAANEPNPGTCQPALAEVCQ